MSVANKIEEYMRTHKINLSEFSKGSHVPYTTLDGIFKKGDENIKLSTMKKIADFMGCTLDELAEVEPVTTVISVTPEEFNLISTYRKLSKSGKFIVSSTANALMQSESDAFEKGAENFG